MSKKKTNQAAFDQCFKAIKELDIDIACLDIPRSNLAALESAVQARRALTSVADNLAMVESNLAE